MIDTELCFQQYCNQKLNNNESQKLNRNHLTDIILSQSYYIIELNMSYSYLYNNTTACTKALSWRQTINSPDTTILKRLAIVKLEISCLSTAKIVRRYFMQAMQYACEIIRV